MRGMKIILVIYSVLLMLLNPEGDIPYTEIQNGFVQQKADLVLNTSGEKIMLSIQGKGSVLSKIKAQTQLQDFLDQHPKSEFAYTLKGMKSDEGITAIGKFTSKTEKFSCKLFFTWQVSSYKLTSLNLTSED